VEPEVTAAALVCGVVFFAMMALTATGEQRRGQLIGALVAGLCFPIAWAVLYVRDEHPYRPPRH
jgi:hypothetical protein